MHPQSEVDSAEIEEMYLLPPGRHVRANFVTSIDGAVEVDGRSGSLGGPADREVFTALRSVADVVLVGAGTVRAENYGPVRLDADRRERRLARAQTALPRIAVVTNSGNVHGGSRLFAEGAPSVLVLTTAAVAGRNQLPRSAEVVGCGDTTVDVGAALDALFERGLGRVLCEGGPTLMRSLLERDLLDELCLTISPVLAGFGHRRLLGDDALGAPYFLQFGSMFATDGMLMTRYRRR